MKKFFFVLCLFAASSSSFANTCRQLEEVGQNIMIARQNEIPKERVLAVFREFKLPALNSIVDVAYKYPLYASAANKRKAVSDFGAEVYQYCLEISPRTL